MAAYRALRQGLMDFERRQVYRGPEKFIQLPNDPKLADEAIDDALEDLDDDADDAADE
jgi:penicillin-binding protein 1A